MNSLSSNFYGPLAFNLSDQSAYLTNSTDFPASTDSDSTTSLEVEPAGAVEGSEDLQLPSPSYSSPIFFSAPPIPYLPPLQEETVLIYSPDLVDSNVSSPAQADDELSAPTLLETAFIPPHSPTSDTSSSSSQSFNSETPVAKRAKRKVRLKAEDIKRNKAAKAKENYLKYRQGKKEMRIEIDAFTEHSKGLWEMYREARLGERDLPNLGLSKHTGMTIRRTTEGIWRRMLVVANTNAIELAKTKAELEAVKAKLKEKEEGTEKIAV